MSRKNLTFSLAALLLFTVVTALLWRHHFASMPPLLRDLAGGLAPGMHVMGDSPEKDAIAIQGMAAAARRGDPGAQFLHALTLEHVDMKEALHWYKASADQGYEMAIARLKELQALEEQKAREAQASREQRAGS